MFAANVLTSMGLTLTAGVLLKLGPPASAVLLKTPGAPATAQMLAGMGAEYSGKLFTVAGEGRWSMPAALGGCRAQLLVVQCWAPVAV